MALSRTHDLLLIIIINVAGCEYNINNIMLYTVYTILYYNITINI